MSINKRLAEIQQALKAPKDLENKFGKYSYRSAEGILEAVKPLLKELTLTVSDDMVCLGMGESARFYVQANVVLSDGENFIKISAYARESFDKKGMDTAQITGAASSYAKKYALNGMFAIDDTKDPDATNKHGKTESPKLDKEVKKPADKPKRTRTAAPPKVAAETVKPPTSEASNTEEKSDTQW